MKKVIINHFMYDATTGEATLVEQLLCQEREHSYKIIGGKGRQVIWKRHLNELNGRTWIQTYSLGDIEQFKRSIIIELKLRIDLCERRITYEEHEIKKYKEHIERLKQ